VSHWTAEDECDADLLWKALRRHGDRVAREKLAERHSELVRILAAKTYRNRFSEELEYADYYQFGMVGLLEAIDRFDPVQGVRFETFASPRIRGAILNGVESLSEKQRQLAVRLRVRNERVNSLGAQEDARDSEDALAKLADVAVGIALGLLLDNAGLYLVGEPATGDLPYDRVEMAELRRLVVRLVDLLPHNERRIIRGHYLQAMPFDEMAKSLGLTKGRISQIHHAALRRMRDLYQRHHAPGVEL
jgi:RNA polymerase sigma factor for flagellar operon FliA